ncbi:signal peptidase I [Enterococcus sp. AZ192]|uniref:signal peptidase I n=1 Tax=unclassified Enterococcus TaxID=2608891 RepID=UPI003D2AC323
MKKRISEGNKQKKQETVKPPTRKKIQDLGVSAKRKQKSKISVKKKKALKRKRMLRDVILASFLTIILAVVISSFFFKVTKVHGFSMISTLRDEDVLVVKKRAELKRFDLVAFVNKKNNIQVRRVIGLSGEKITYEGDTLYVDDQRVDEKFIVEEINESQANGKNFTEDFMSGDLTSTKTIPDGYYLVLGDNRPYAADSRVYGLISAENVVGKVTIRLLPLINLQAF